MSQIEEYKRLWTEHGITNIEEYNKLAPTLCRNKEFCEHFKNLDYKSFWNASHDFFGTDPICNNSSKLSIDLDLQKIEHANKLNWSIAHYCGVMGMFDLFFMNCKARGIVPHIGEIGAGYGCIFEYLKTKDPTSYNYTGFDIIPRFDDVVEVGDDGCFTGEQVKTYESKFNLMYSFNVFQHLEKHQIENYINHSFTMLDKSNLSSMILGICLDKSTFHYGQVVELPTTDEFHQMIEGKFEILSTYRSFARNQYNLHLFHMDTIKL